jgi:CubicO group peptidase (beta-lactamase class C family)
MGDLQDKLDELLAEHGVPGATAGVVLPDGEERAYAGVTSVDNPLPVDAKTVFQFGSTGKTFTATTLMLLQEQGRVDLSAPVRTYVPELRLKDESVAERVTVLQLLNHTAGWSGDAAEEHDDSDEALARFVASMAELEQVTPLGATVSYNNAALSLAGRVIEKVTGKTFEQAVRDLVLTPLQLDSTHFFCHEIMTLRFSVGHVKDDDLVRVARPWALPRAGNPAGGMTANLADQLAWARFHLGDGSPLLSKGSLDLMKEPTADMQGSALGDFVGISWLLEDIEGVRVVKHGGSMIGQYSEFVLVPSKGFGFTVMSNCGGPLNRELTDWVLEHYCGLVPPPTEAVELTEAELTAYTGRFETVAAVVDITAAEPRLIVNVSMNPGALGEMEDPGPQPPIPLQLTGDDRYVVADGPAKGMRGYFTRSDDGSVAGVHLGGRLAVRA